LSENGPREGTRELPKRSPDAGYRAVDEGSAAGAAYNQLVLSLRRRRAELVALAMAGLAEAEITRTYGANHPLEPSVSAREIEVAVRAARRETPKHSA